MSFQSNCTIALLAVAFVAGSGCQRGAPESASVQKDSVPGTGSVILSEHSQESIGLQVAEASRRSVRAQISTTGWLVPKPGNQVVVRAVATGFVVPPTETDMVRLGSAVSDGQVLATLHILVTPQDEAQLVALKEDADVVIEQSLASLAVAEARYEDIKDLAGDGLPRRELESLKELVARSRAAVQEARDKLPFLPAEPYSRPLRLQDVKINTPMGGRISEIHIRPRQLVVQGDPLWTITDWSTLWLKVPIFEGDLLRVDQTQDAQIASAGLQATIAAKPTNIPQATTEGRRTVDVLYELSNRDGRLRPGQPVSVAVPTGQSSEHLMIPSSAVLWDAAGGSWVYVRENKEHFRRQRVQLGQIHGDEVVVERGLQQGEPVVATGAEALYGQEFRSQIESGDEN